MAGYGPESYGDAFADVYDDWYADVTDVEACTDALAELAQGGTALELGVGTGRLAIPLAARGVSVTGVDASNAMLERLAAADPARTVMAVRADFGTEIPNGPFDVVFAAYNTFFNLLTEEAQLTCLRLVEARLALTGHLVVEAYVPRPEARERGVDGRLTDEGVVLNVAVRDDSTQVVRGQQVELTNDGVKLRPWQVRYLRPDQLDELAEDAGLMRVARWSEWSGAAFDNSSSRHISVYAPQRRSSSTPVRP